MCTQCARSSCSTGSKKCWKLRECLKLSIFINFSQLKVTAKIWRREVKKDLLVFAVCLSWWSCIESERTCLWEPLPISFIQKSGFKMKAELKKIFKLFEKLEEACKTASLTLLTKGGKSMIKLQLESSLPLPGMDGEVFFQRPGCYVHNALWQSGSDSRSVSQPTPLNLGEWWESCWQQFFTDLEAEVWS